MVMKIKINTKLDKHLKSELENLEKEHRGQEDGLTGLFNDLIQTGQCESTSNTLIYFAAYTLSTSDIDFKVM